MLECEARYWLSVLNKRLEEWQFILFDEKPRRDLSAWHVSHQVHAFKLKIKSKRKNGAEKLFSAMVAEWAQWSQKNEGSIIVITYGGENSLLNTLESTGI